MHVDGSFTIAHQDEINTFHGHLNEQNPDLEFTKQIEENGKLPFLCDGARRWTWTSDIVRLTSPNVPFILVGQDKMSDSHLSEKDTNVH